MKTLLIMRHGKSSWKHKELKDHERPLSKRGTKDSVKMGELLRERELVPQLILVSTAVRTIETAKLLVESSGFQGDTIALDSLYLAEAEEYLHDLLTLPNEIERVMIIGHNPGLEALLQILSGRIEALPTGVVAYISLPINHWSDVHNKIEGELVELWRPKELHDVEPEEEVEVEKEDKKEKVKKEDKKELKKDKHPKKKKK
jgi:phosphohistidine phosphatase